MSKFTYASLLFVITLLAGCFKSEECKLAEQQLAMKRLEVMRYEQKDKDIQNREEIIEDDISDNNWKLFEAEKELGDARMLKSSACE